MKADPTNALEVSVSELSTALKKTVEDTFGYVRVRGEISGFRGPHSSGHCYFSLKDERARLEAVIWRGVAGKLKHMPEEGMEVVASGKLTTYPGSSKYQIVIDALEPAGAGALMAMLEKRRLKLAAEGLFDEARKQLLPFMPKVIAVVTSPTGAVIRDVLHRLNDRFPLHVIVWPVRVQGETSGAEVANGIYQLNNLPEDKGFAVPDVIIVARGGGSLEDLWGFNDEAVVRAAANSMVPVISAVGHETDWTLLDHVADWRAPTPTAAAEKAVPVKADLEAQLAGLSARLRAAQSRYFDQRNNALQAIARGIASPDMLLALPRRRLDEASGRLFRGLDVHTNRAKERLRRFELLITPGGLVNLISRLRDRLGHATSANSRGLLALISRKRSQWEAIERQLRPQILLARTGERRSHIENLASRSTLAYRQKIELKKRRVDQADKLLQSLSYAKVLARGFALVRDASGIPVRAANQVSEGELVSIQFAKDSTTARIEPDSTMATHSKSAPKKRAKPEVKPKTDQGSLF